MPVNPFGQDDPLAPGGNGTAPWTAGQGAGGFGAKPADRDDYGAESDQYEVVDIAEPGAAKSAPPPKKTGGKAPTERDLAAREAALNAREAELRRREAQMARRPIGYDPMAVKNWPPCMPIVHHDIPNDIPVFKQGITRAGFIVYLLTALALTWNAVAVLIALIVSSQVNSAGSLIFALLYMIIGVPAAWVLWYARLYRAMMTDGAISFATFFFVFLIHTAFAVWSAISPQIIGTDFAHTGFFAAIDLIKGDGGGDKLAGILFFVGAGLWTLLSFLSFTFLFRVYAFFRNAGGEQRLANEAAAAGTSYAVTNATRR